MSLREKLLKEYASEGGDPESIPEHLGIDEIRGEIETQRKEKQDNMKQPDWRDRLSEDDKAFVRQLERWNYLEDTIKEIVSTGFNREEYHEQMNEIIRARNEAKARHGLEELVEPLLPTGEAIIDMNSHGILDDWLNHSPDPDRPSYKPNKQFEPFAREIVMGLEIEQVQKRKTEEIKATIKEKYKSLTGDIPKRVLTEKGTGDPYINPKFRDWLSKAQHFRKELEKKTKIYESQEKEGFQVEDELSLVRVTRRNLIDLIEEKSHKD